MNKSRTLVFFGTEDFSAVSLRALIDAGYNVAAVVTKPDSPRGRNRSITAPLVKDIANEHSIRVFQPQKLTEIAQDLKNIGSACGVLVSYGKIIPLSIIELFTPGIINVHPSLLPKCRGPSPIESVILAGDKETGVSIMLLTAAMDAGPIYVQKRIPLSGHETRPYLYHQLAHLGADMLLETLPGILSGSLTPAPQEDTEAIYCPMLSKDIGIMNPAVFTADELERQVRAYLGYPKSRLTVNGQQVVVTKAKITSESTPKTLVITCKGGTYLEILELIGPGGKTMTGQAFYHGYLNAS
jgi:methionyl-tRNA formyltransferase